MCTYVEFGGGDRFGEGGLGGFMCLGLWLRALGGDFVENSGTVSFVLCCIQYKFQIPYRASSNPTMFPMKSCSTPSLPPNMCVPNQPPKPRNRDPNPNYSYDPNVINLTA